MNLLDAAIKRKYEIKNITLNRILYWIILAWDRSNAGKRLLRGPCPR
jgi:hypothetical protein